MTKPSISNSYSRRSLTHFSVSLQSPIDNESASLDSVMTQGAGLTPAISESQERISLSFSAAGGGVESG